MIAALAVLDTGFEKQIYMNSEGVRARVVSVNNEGVYNTGLIKQGAQSCVIEILSGSHKGETAPATNFYTGKLEFDKVFSPGDIAWVLLERGAGDNIVFANMVEHYRIDKELTLICLFALGIILLSGFTGIRTLLSFAFALLAIWKILVPGMLRGYDPVLLALIIGNLITVATLLLVGGFTKKAYAATLGSVACSLFTCLLAILLGRWFNIHGAVMQWSESLLYAGFEHLDLTAIFQAGIYLACSGAILDLAIDISSALDEVALANPAVTRGALLRSGLTIGRSVVGSQTTTLLLAYMGSYISVMMVYMAQGTPMMSIFNSKMVAAEILHTFVGCIGLILVCPCTAAISAAMYRRAPAQAHGRAPQPLAGDLPVE
ncbi:MAG TPA: YibE/F family protein [Feifaniaceae bacterium]|nr:YibE/F family protein [Feifaniaceae bacterium]